MLTSLKNPIRSNWKYLTVLPALLACTFFLARAEGPSRIQNGNSTTYKGNTFQWSEPSVDSIQVIDPVSGEQLFMTKENPPVIVKANDAPVYTSEEVNLSAMDREGNRGVTSDLTQALLHRRSEIPDSIVHIQLRNVVLSPKGKIVYYEAFYSTDKEKSARKWFTTHAVLDPMLEAIVEDSEAWEPAFKDGKPVFEFLPELFTMSL